MKKLSATKQILNLLNTKGSSKVKNLIAELKLPSANIYAGLSYLRKNKHVTKDAGGVYHALTSAVFRSPLATKTKRIDLSQVPVNNSYTSNLQKENKQLTEWAQMWKHKCEKLEADCTQAKIMYLDSQAVVKYLEEKVAQLIKE